MSGATRTGAALPGAMPLPAITDLERAAAGYAPVMWWSGREAPPEVRGCAIRDRIRAVAWTGQGTAYYDQVGSPARPVVRFSGGANSYMKAPFQIPQSYGVFVLARMNGFVTGTGNVLLASKDNTGNRSFLSVSPGGDIQFAHTGDSVETGSGHVIALNTDFVAWAGFDATDHSAAVGLNTLTAQATGSFTNLQKGQSESAIGGWEDGSGNGVSATNGWIEEVIVVGAPIHKAAYADMRAVFVNYLAARAGIVLS